MKRILFVSTMAIVAIATSLLNQTGEKAQTSDASMLNIEALSRGEQKGYKHVTYIDYPWGTGCNCVGEGELICC